MLSAKGVIVVPTTVRGEELNLFTSSIKVGNVILTLIQLAETKVDIYDGLNTCNKCFYLW